MRDFKKQTEETDKKAIEDNRRLALARKQRKAMIIYGIENEPDMIWTKMVMPSDLVVKPREYEVF